MADSLPSLALLLDLVRDERSKQIALFDALDNKAGIVLGFAGSGAPFNPWPQPRHCSLLVVSLERCEETVMTQRADQEPEEAQEPPKPPDPQPDLNLIGYFERGYPGPRRTTDRGRD